MAAQLKIAAQVDFEVRQERVSAREAAADLCESIGAALAHRGADHVGMGELLRACTRAYRARLAEDSNAIR